MDTDPQPQVLQDNAHRVIVRIGNTVRRPALPSTPTIHALLKHLRSVGFTAAPEVFGYDEMGREVLEYFDGESGPDGWAKVVTEDGLRAFAHLLKAYHAAVATFVPPADAQWRSPRAPAYQAGDVICHGDFYPCNIVWRGDQPIGVIDWDEARPGSSLRDVAYALEYAAPFRDDQQAVRWWRYPTPPDRLRRIEIFAEAYGLDDTRGLVDAVIASQRDDRAMVADMASRGTQPQAKWVSEGYLDELDQRIDWSETHRSFLER